MIPLSNYVPRELRRGGGAFLVSEVVWIKEDNKNKLCDASFWGEKQEG